jgi:hypothetical protein
MSYVSSRKIHAVRQHSVKLCTFVKVFAACHHINVQMSLPLFCKQGTLDHLLFVACSVGPAFPQKGPFPITGPPTATVYVNKWGKQVPAPPAKKAPSPVSAQPPTRIRTSPAPVSGGAATGTGVPAG